MTALVISFIMGPRTIRWLKKKQREGQPIRQDGPESHIITKQGTPTMGGVLILSALELSTLLWADLRNPYVWIVLFVTVGFGLVGFFDDFLKLTRRSSRGLPSRTKFLAQLLVGLVASVLIARVTRSEIATSIALPFVKNLLLELTVWGFVPWSVFVMTAWSNAVNLTDGLDGLAIVPTMFAAGCFAFIPTSSATLCSPIICRSITSPAPASSPCCAAPWSAPASVFCGSTRRRRRSSWATPARWRSAA
jgi:phospho-N-acetylmuramoyl-pentapeptide-transferase